MEGFKTFVDDPWVNDCVTNDDSLEGSSGCCSSLSGHSSDTDDSQITTDSGKKSFDSESDAQKPLKTVSSTCKGMINGRCCQMTQDGFAEEPTILFDKNRFKPFDPSQEPIFPPELKLFSSNFNNQTLCFKSETMTWYRPTNLTDLLKIKSDHPEAKIVVGNTELGVEMKFKNRQYPIMIQANLVRPKNLFHDIFIELEISFLGS